LNAVLLAFSLTILSIAVIDLQSFVSRFKMPPEDKFELGFALPLYIIMYHVILASKPFFECTFSEFKVKAGHVLNRTEAFS
jgi:hypothetical protein